MPITGAIRGSSARIFGGQQVSAILQAVQDPLRSGDAFSDSGGFGRRTLSNGVGTSVSDSMRSARALAELSSFPEGSKTMDVLNNPRWERFAQELAKGKTADQAYVIAGYTQDRGHATRLAANGSIQARMSELLSKAAEVTLITVESLTHEYKRNLADARIAGQHGVVVRALDSLAKLHGLWTRQHEHKSQFEHMTDAELDAVIEKGALALGYVKKDAAADEICSSLN